MSFSWRGKRCLITGASGFVGAHLARRLVDEGAIVFALVFNPRKPSPLDALGVRDKVKVIVGDIREYELLESILKSHRIDTCFHLAAASIVEAAKRSPIFTFQTNITGTWNVLEAARRWGGLRRTVVASSDKAYGEYPEEMLPYREEYELMGTGIYSCSKACADMIARAYFIDYSLPVTITRCSNIYGPADPNLSRIIPGTIAHILNGEPPAIFEESQYHIREYTY